MDSNHFNEVNQFIENNLEYIYPPEHPNDYRFDVRNEHELVEDADFKTLIKLIKFLKRGKAPGPDTIHNEVLRLGTTPPSSKAIYLFHTTGIHPSCMENSYPMYV